MGNSFGMQKGNGISNAVYDFLKRTCRNQWPVVVFKIVLEIPVFTELEDEVEVVGSFKSVKQLNDIRVVDAADYRHFLRNHLFLLRS